MTTNGLICKVIEKKGKRVKIEVEGQSLEVPTEILPKDTREGEVVKLFFLSSDQASLQEKKLAKLILEEILNGK